jgi:diguanylate cyclase (GGDEF)-like protein
MGINLNELKMYKNFNELAMDILDLAKKVMPDRLLFLSAFTDSQQVVLKLSDDNTEILISEGMAINLNDTICNRIDFDQNKPLIFEDISQEACLDDIKQGLKEVNVNSYLGVPITLTNGEAFGTLCAVHQNAGKFNESSVQLIEKIAKMFSYYLELERMAYRDYLTGLYNRQYLYKSFHDLSGSKGALFFLDLDGFKKINDLYGHEAGDRILQSVSQRLEKIVKEINGYAVRLGGDEFIINMSERSDKEELCKLADLVLSQLSSWDPQLKNVNLTVSIGIVPYLSSKDTNLDTLLKQADDALYRAKSNGKNTYIFTDQTSLS